jgi:DNA-binding PadR family transcriptional regulator
MAPRQDASVKLTEHEGMLLSVVLREEPLTAHQIYKIFEQSPVISINASKGQLYPAIARLKKRGLLHGRKVAGDARKTEDLSTTDAGREAVRSWTNDITDAHVVLDDPLRTRLFSFTVLTREERLQWIARAKALIKQRREAVTQYNKSVDVPYQEFAYRSIMESLRLKMEWLDDLLFDIASD